MARDYGAMRASDADRARVQSHLNDAYAEGRLNQQEWDERATALASAMTYTDLDRLTADLPRNTPGAQLAPPRQAWPQAGPQNTNGLAMAALVCGLGQFAVGPPASIAAIVLGHKARRRIALTGEQGDGMAQAGLILGYAGIGLLVVLLCLFLLVAVGSTAPVGR